MGEYSCYPNAHAVSKGCGGVFPCWNTDVPALELLCSKAGT